VSTACWIRKVLDGRVPLPQPIANQMAACLFACGYAEDFNQAKAIVAVESNGHAAA
jgi:anthranilate phosphoribosyltransferase